MKTITLFLSTVALCVCLIGCAQPAPQARKAEPTKVQRLDADLFQHAKGAVGAQLKAPASADFSPRGESRILVLKDFAVVSGWVDAANSYGAKLRNSYRCTLTLDAAGQVTGQPDCDIGDRHKWEIEPNQPGQNVDPRVVAMLAK